MGRLLEIAAWLLGGAAVLCVPLIPFVVVIAALRPDVLGMTWAALASVALVVAPCVLIPAALALYDTGRRLRHGGLNHGYCRRCGYDLRAARGEVCPECGTEI